MAKNMRTCKICGKKYEYCGHCPSKNSIEPWRNLYCSEDCREVFGIFDKYASKKITAEKARERLSILGFDPSNIRDIHKPIINEIFRDAQKKEIESKDKFDIPLAHISEVDIGEPVLTKTPKLIEEKKSQKSFRPKPKFVNDKKKTT